MGKIYADVMLYAHQLREGFLTGIQRVIGELCKEALLGNHEPFVFCYQCEVSQQLAVLDLNPRSGTAEFTGRPINLSPDDTYLLMDLRGEVFSSDAMRQKLLSSGATLTALVYDCLPLQLGSNYFEPSLIEVYKKYVADVSSCFDRVICISERVAKECQSHFCNTRRLRAKPLRFDSFRLGFSPLDKGSVDQFSGKAKVLLQSEQPIILCVGTIEKRKEYIFALDVFDSLRRSVPTASFFVVGKPGNDTVAVKRLDEAESDSRVVWLPDATDGQLEFLYRRANVLFYPSRGEGYGLPIIEAAYYGCSVVAHEPPSVTESSGLGARAFVHYDVEEVSALLKETLFSDATQSESGSHHFVNWQQSYSELISLLKDGG